MSHGTDTAQAEQVPHVPHTNGNGHVPPITIVAGRPDRHGRRPVTATTGEIEHHDEIRVARDDDRRKFVRRLAARLDVEPATLAHLPDEICDAAERADNEAGTPPPSPPAPVDPATEVPPEITAAAEAYLQSPNILTELLHDFGVLGIVGEVLLATTLYLICVSRLVRKPLGTCIQAASGSGKSYVAEIVVDLMPEEERLIATDMTPNSLYYLEEGSLRHCVIFVGERRHANTNDPSDSANATLALREMLTRGRLDKYVATHTRDGQMVTRHIRQDGPIAYVETTTQEQIFDEDATRMLQLTTDESDDQTTAIMQHQAREAAGLTASDVERNAIRLKHQTAQHRLQPVTVRIPYAQHLVIPSNKIAARRAYRHLLGVIEAVAVLRQFQHQVHDGVLFADVEDFTIAYDLMLPVLSRVYQEMTDGARATLAAIRTNVPAATSLGFTRRECAEWSGISGTSTANRLQALVVAGLVEEVQGGRGRTYLYRLRPVAASQRATVNSLITPDQLRDLLAAGQPASTSQPTS